MAKKAVKKTTRKKTAKKAARKTASKKKAAPKKATASKKAAKKTAKKATRKAAPKKAAKPKKAARKTAAKQKPAPKKSAKKATRKAAPKKAAKKATAKKSAGKAAPKKAAPKKATAKKAAPKKAPARKAATKAAATATAEPESKRLKKSPYNKRSLAPLRKALITLRERIVRDLNLMGDEALRAGENEVDSEDVADFGSDAFERTMTLNLMENDARTLQKIDLALDDIQAGQYGICDECGGAIPLPRLEALPFAQTCIPCQEKQESLF